MAERIAGATVTISSFVNVRVCIVEWMSSMTLLQAVKRSVMLFGLQRKMIWIDTISPFAEMVNVYPVRDGANE